MPDLSDLFSSFADDLEPEPVWMRESRADLKRYAEHVFDLQLKPFHARLLDELQKWHWYPQGDPRRAGNQQNVLVLLPRGTGKSTLVCAVYPSWRIGLSRNLRFIISSNTEAQGKMFLRQLESIMLYVPRYRELFGNLVPDARTLTWTDIEKIVLGRTDPFLKDATFYTVGVGGAVINRRADIIITDDIVDQENVSTKFQRDKLEAWFWQSVRPVLEPGGQLIVSGTRYHQGDLYGKLIRLWQDEYNPSDSGLIAPGL